MSKLIVGNWKMNPPTFAEAEKLVRAAAVSAKRAAGKARVVLCPPFVWLTDLSHKKHSGLEFGAQDVFWEQGGAYTGEISAPMLKGSNVRYVIVGHSERRRWLGETDEMAGKKCAAALRAGITPILCVGEPLAVRKSGTAHVLRYVRRQLAAAARRVPKGLRRTIVVAYEPIWAIGTGIPCAAYEAERMVRACAAYLAIKEKFKNVIGLYGGSVSARNAGSYLSAKYIDGLLVGGASVRADEFRKVIAASRSAG
jgi:triosephosphate isomerase